MIVPEKIYDQDLFCLKYLLDRGWFDDGREEVEQYTNTLSTDFELVRLNLDFFTELATKMRELWPTGEKDGKFPWRDSVDNLAKRLKALWTIRRLQKFDLEQCLSVTRKYLAQYEDNTKYMRILKYFILKQSTVTESNGRRRLINESPFADMLENSESMNTFPEELDVQLQFQEELI